MHRATALLSLAIWLFMVAAENYTPLHAWLHGGAIPDDDDCAVVALAHGKVETAAIPAPVVLPVTWIEVVPRPNLFHFIAPVENLTDSRGPPSQSAAS